MVRHFCTGWLLVVTVACAVTGQESRQWTNLDGRTVEATYVRLDDDMVVIRNEKGEFRVELAKLSEADRTYVQGLEAQREARRAVRSEIREWKFFGGETFRGKLVGIVKGKAQFRNGSQVVLKSWYELDLADREHLYDSWEAAGELEQQVEKLLKDDTTKSFVQNELGSRELRRQREKQIKSELASANTAQSSQAVASSETVEAPLNVGSEPANPPQEIAENGSASSRASSQSAVADAGAPEPMAAAALPMPAAPMLNVPPSATDPLPRTGIHSDDPWERDQAVMQASNRAAYLWLGSILALLVVFGPIIYAIQRMRQ